MTNRIAEIAARYTNEGTYEFRDVGSCTLQDIRFLLSQLAAAQRRERAAVEDILVAHNEGRCEVCKHKRQDGGACKKWPDRSCFEWRGPQDAGEEETI